MQLPAAPVVPQNTILSTNNFGQAEPQKPNEEVPLEWDPALAYDDSDYDFLLSFLGESSSSTDVQLQGDIDYALA